MLKNICDFVHYKVTNGSYIILTNNERALKLLRNFSPTGVEPVSVFIGRIYAHTSLLPLQIRQVFPAVNASSGRKSAPEKLLCTFRRELFGWFWMQRTQAYWRKSRTISPKAPDKAAEMRCVFDSRWTSPTQVEPYILIIAFCRI